MQRWVGVLVVVLMGAVAAAGAKIPGPRIPAGVFNIVDYGAVGDGTTVNTDAISKAMAACEKAGGGTIIVPAGRFLTGPFKLISNLNLKIAKDATLMFPREFDAFPVTNKRHVDEISGQKLHDIAITGPGTIDGQGTKWWEKYRKHKGPGSQPSDVLPHRPHLIFLDHCERVLVEDVHLINSPMFHLVPQECRDVTVQRIRIEAPQTAPNTDGLDPSGRNYLITDCYFDTGDDCIAVKPVAHAELEAGHVACEDIEIRNCTFKHGHGLSIGGQTEGGLRRMSVRDCTFEDTENGLRLKAARGNGGVVEDVSFENITMKNVGIAILFTSYYPKPPADMENDPARPVEAKKTPVWRNIRVTNLKAEGSDVAGQIFGLPEMPIVDVRFTNVRIQAGKGMHVVHARGVEFKDAEIQATKGPPIIVQDAAVSGLSRME